MTSDRRPRRPAPTAHPWCAVGLALSILAGCSSSGQPVVDPSPSGSVASACQAVMSALPSTVDGAARAWTGHDAASWGTPSITLRCGVAKPAGLGPTSQCNEINGVGWFAEQQRDGWRFTTIGRTGYVEVTVPGHYTPAADALVDLTTAVRAMPQVKACQ